ncbi:DUF4145 domain-containing protein [Runella sp. MFBS21]|uniref:DUF4145 domain-containing protein n=1 Tax=Runella sp. MFBS21 TaxID=3034018 RepID=UPI0023F98997|nr:DUF4145 domain-containing protein [Runella sp. MFBS21]MDF7821386.1 DUF4145 domain-containing protein [Runella sp. MFBS21]
MTKNDNSNISCNKGHRHFLFDFPKECPHCHSKIQPIPIFLYHGRVEFSYALLSCPDEKNCNMPFIAFYKNAQHDHNQFIFQNQTSFGRFKNKDFSEIIKNISPKFCQIYNEAYIAEQHDLLEICGVGYRKALEFLIKDYLILQFTDKSEQIANDHRLQKVINDFITNDNIKNSATKAFWLGNDEAHYVRKWQNKDLKDLKQFIYLSISWIELEEQTKSMNAEMN